MKGFRYLENVTTLAVDEGKCTGCGFCAQVCPHNVIAVEMKKVRLLDRDACIECGACALNCSSKAISVDAGVGCASGMINEWLRERGWKKDGAGGC